MIATNDLKTIKSILFSRLKPDEVHAFIYGSWAVGNNRKFSDIDIGIESKKPISTEALGYIREAFEESDFPYIVEIVDFKNVSAQFQEVAKQKIIPLNQIV